jgi:hypothetical protein
MSVTQACLFLYKEAVWHYVVELIGSEFCKVSPWALLSACVVAWPWVR